MAAANPWSEYRDIAETIADAFATSLTASTGNPVSLGVIETFSPEQMVGERPMPLRAVVVRFERPFRDAIVLISSLKDDVIAPIADAGVRAILKAFDVTPGSDEQGAIGEYIIEEGVEYEDVAEALEQCDGLYLEACYGMELPASELRLVLGTGLLESVNCVIHGIADPFGASAPYVAPDLAPPLPPREPRNEFEEATPAVAAATAPVAVGAPAIADFDAMLAQQEQAEAEAVTAIAAAANQANTAAAAARVTADATAHWTSLLSGVEVELSAELGRADLALGDITNLAAESVLTLDQLVNDPVTVYVNGMPYATARLVVVDGEYGIEILEVSDQQQFVSTLAA